MEFFETNIPGVKIVQASVKGDTRGSLIKIFHSDIYKSEGLEPIWNECYFSNSESGILRGLHFQLPPSDHAKLVTCVTGHVFDVAVDLRQGSDTYGQHVALILDSEIGNAIFLPSGIAHGFCTTDSFATLCYLTTSVYDPELDSGIAWDSVGIPWPTKNPKLSERDSKFVRFSEFNSPF